MKKILNGIILFSLLFVLIIHEVNSIELYTSNDVFKIYEIKEKEEILVVDNKIIDFYEENHEELEHLIEEKKEEEERLAKEARISFKTKVVNFAKMFIGNPYVMGGNSLTDGTDCSGFVMLVYGNFGISLPRTTTGQAESGVEVSIDDIEIGDIISYGYDGYATHSAIYIGDGRIVHAGTVETGITTVGMYIMPIVSIRRVA